MDRYDVLVCGGGPSGFVAAVASARLGVKTLLIERYGFLGGMPTAAALGPISPFHFGDEQVVKGVPQEFVDRMVASGGSTGHLRCTNPHGSGSYLCFYDREHYKWTALSMLKEAGADVLFHAIALEAIPEEHGIGGIRCATKSGILDISARVVVDATGDADIAARAGAEMCVGRSGEGQLQPGTLMFDMANADSGELKAYMDGHPEDFEWASECVPLRAFSEQIVQRHFVGQGFGSQVEKARNSGELHLGRDSILFLTTCHPNVLHFNSTRVTGLDGTSAYSLSEAEEEGRRQVMSLASFLTKHVPGLGHAYLGATGVQVGVRETRHVMGEYVLTGDDVLAGRKFADVVARGYFPIDIHSPTGASGYDGDSVWSIPQDSYDIPLRCLIPKRIDGLVIAGRAISATHEAHGSFRTQGGVMAIGQAAGVSAALASLHGTQPRQVAVEEVQRVLVAQGASLWRDNEQMAREQAAAHRAVSLAVESGAITGRYFARETQGAAPRL